MCQDLADPDNQLESLLGMRRTGKTECPGTWLLARCVAYDHCVVRILTWQLSSPTRNWLDRKGDEISALALLEKAGLYDRKNPASSPVKVMRAAGSIVQISFPWGSLIEVHDMGNQQALDADRGLRADYFWIDEAQHLALLAAVLTQLIFPTMAERRTKVLVGGSPGLAIDGIFHRASRGLDGWRAHRFYSFENPAFGSTDTERWQKVCDDALRPARASYGLGLPDFRKLRALNPTQLRSIAEGTEKDSAPELAVLVAGLDPDLLREFFGRWVTTGVGLVLPWRRRPPEHWYWCAERKPNEDEPVVNRLLPTLESRVVSLPLRWSGGEWIKPQWRVSLGMDFGYSPDPCAWVAVVWAPDYPAALVLHSEKENKLDDNQAFERLVAIIKRIEATGLHVATVRADLTGIRQGTYKAWDKDLKLRALQACPQLLQPSKHVPLQRIRAMRIDMLAGRFFAVQGDALDLEGRNLRWKDPSAATKTQAVDDKRKAIDDDGREFVPGDHAIDALLYASQDYADGITAVAPLAEHPSGPSFPFAGAAALKRIRGRAKETREPSRFSWPDGVQSPTPGPLDGVPDTDVHV